MRTRTKITIFALFAFFAFVTGGDAQMQTRRATNLAALLAFPGYYHGRPILIVGKVTVEKDEFRVHDESERSIHLLFKGTPPDGFDEIRGEFWDVGRMKPDDPKLSGYDLRNTFKFDPDGPWPRPGEVTAIVATSVASTAAAPPASIRTIVLQPSRFLDQKVAITGQFSGRNLLGDLPDAPAKSRYDFVLRAADAAIWVINMRPRMKDANGKDLELGLDARIDTGRWLSVRGTIQQGRGLLWLDAEAGSLALARPPTETTAAEEEPIRVPAGPPPEVVFSAPTQDETDVLMGTSVRIQFSRDIDASTLKNRIRAGYLQSQSVERGEPTAPPADFTYQYAAFNRVLEIKFKQPLERFRTVKIELLEGVMGTDSQPLKPWTLTFQTGGS
ncbi:MAG TPA: Ig-like domain-containing protein [Vicinamibacterales bacterium]|nr:Ig-like domain-containing protein [Vicinamibacterales bacterium]